MPQMAPINWLSLYILFLFIFLIFIIMNFYSFMYTPKLKKLSQTIMKINWKW